MSYITQSLIKVKCKARKKPVPDVGCVTHSDSSISTLPVKCWCHRVFYLERSKVSCLTMRAHSRKNIDYQRVIRQKGSVQSSLLRNTNGLKPRHSGELRERWQENNVRTLRTICVGNTREEKTSSSSGDTSVLTLRGWTSLRQMPMTGGRGEIWYLKKIYSLE